MIIKDKYLISGCSHKGILNIIQEGKKYAPIDSFIGGTHLSKTPPEKVIDIAEKLNELGIKSILTGHCTEVEAYCLLKNYINKVDYAHTGREFQL